MGRTPWESGNLGNETPLAAGQFTPQPSEGSPSFKPPLLGPPQPPLRSVGGNGETAPDWDNWSQTPTRSAREDKSENARQRRRMQRDGSIWGKRSPDDSLGPLG